MLDCEMLEEGLIKKLMMFKVFILRYENFKQPHNNVAFFVWFFSLTSILI